jgi:hypothetical protein
MEGPVQLMIHRAESVRYAKDFVAARSLDSLSSALADEACLAARLIAGLLYVSGYEWVDATDEAGNVRFSAGATRETMQLVATLSKATRSLSGPDVFLLDKVFAVLSGIEHRLDSAVYLPPEMRQARVQAFCEQLGIDGDFFQMILQNQRS